MKGHFRLHSATAERITGEFNFQATPEGGDCIEHIHVDNGEFDLYSN
jgi:hypothetical protein